MTPEGQVISDCLELLRLYGLPHGRLNAGAVRIGKRFVRMAEPGTPDIWFNAPPHGRAGWIEAKSDTGRQSLEQQLFQERVEAVGAAYLLVRSADELRVKLEEIAHAG